MKIKRIVLPVMVTTLALAACVVLMIGLATTRSVAAIDGGQPVTFLDGPWPWYAQEEISVNPEPPILGQPVELCAEVVSNDPANVHVVELAFGVAPFGIGRPFEPIGAVEVVVPPNMGALGCVGWIPPEPGPWAFEVRLFVGEFEPQRSLRVVDLWEPLVPGKEDQRQFVVGPFEEPGQYTLAVKQPLPPGWEAYLTKSIVNLDTPEMTDTVTLITRPPSGIVLGSRKPVVDVEMTLGEVSVGGFVKYDNPPVLLHRNKDPFFAESEINVWPYPPRAGEPTELCVDLYNVSDLPQAVVVNFNQANFGIGLPWYPVNEPIEIMIPPHGHERVCTFWVPKNGGHFCVQVELNILGETPYLAQFSQRNLDVAEPLVPGEPHQLVFEVGNYPQFTNPEPATTDIWLEHDLFLPGWDVAIDPMVLTAVAPGTSYPVTLTVYPPAGIPLPPDMTPIVDVRAMIDTMDGGHVIGGFRKIYRPPVILHRYPDPIYAEREISVHPYPPNAGEPTEVCVELYNPTAMPVDVEVQFLWANFGIGIPFSPINGMRPVHLPPFSKVVECIHWVPPVGGHLCLEVELYINKELSQHSQRNIDVNEPLVPLEPHTLVFPVENPIEHSVDIHLGAIPHLDGWMIELDPEILFDVGPGL
ncbi:MAG: hypothetical protein MUO67_21240, partial [Anaerolineales bacterium]|nr:hypothetical protein [Anaerolineales bacterium]